MDLKERLISKYSSIRNIEDPQRLIRVITIVLIGLVALGIIGVLLNVINNQADDNFALLLNFRLLILTGVIVTGAAVVILAINRAKPEWFFLTIALGLGIIYMFALTPFSGPDEPDHFLSSAYLSGIIMNQGNAIFTRASDFDFSGIIGHHNVPTAYLRLIEEGISRIDSDPTSNWQNRLPYFMQFMPQALGVSLGRLLQLNFLGLFYLGRLFNLFFFVLCGFFAIRALKEFKLPILIIGILPMTLQQAASFNPDSFINGTSILFIAYLIRCLYEREQWSRKDIAVLAVSGILLAPAKAVYFPIVALLLFAAPFKYGWKKTKGYVIGGAIFVAAAVNIAVFTLPHILNYTLVEAPDAERWHGGTNFTVSFIFQYPWETILIFLRTFRHLGEWLFLGLFGRELAGVSIVLPMWYIYVFVFILVASVFYGKRDSWTPSWLHRVLFLAVCGIVVFLNMFVMFIAWTPDTHPFILGLQGRYFTAILPLAVLALRNKWKLDKRLFAYVLIGLSVFMHFLVIRYVLDFTISIL